MWPLSGPSNAELGQSFQKMTKSNICGGRCGPESGVTLILHSVTGVFSGQE